MNGRINLLEGHAGGRLETLLFRAQGLGVVFPASPGPALALQQGIRWQRRLSRAEGGSFPRSELGCRVGNGAPTITLPPSHRSWAAPPSLGCFWDHMCYVIASSLLGCPGGCVMLEPAPVHDCTHQVCTKVSPNLPGTPTLEDGGSRAKGAAERVCKDRFWGEGGCWAAGKTSVTSLESDRP